MAMTEPAVLSDVRGHEVERPEEAIAAWSDTHPKEDA